MKSSVQASAPLASATPTSQVVSTSAQLVAALQAAKGGETILLAGGTYSDILLYKINPASNVTIMSQSATNPAVLTGLNVNVSSNLSFKNLTMATSLYNAPTSTQAATPFVVQGSSNVNFDTVSVHGTMDNNAQNDVNGLRIQASTNVTVSNSEFQQLYNAVTDLNNTNVSFINNSFHDIRNDGIDNGGSSNVTITGNKFTNFTPVGAVGTTGDHADAIQFWTTNTTADVSNITVTNNTITRGTGSYLQGIFITDQVGVHYNNVTVTGNTLTGTEYNGITVQNAVGDTVANNSIIGYDGMQSSLRLQNTSQLTLSNNTANFYNLVGNTSLSQLVNKTAGISYTLATGSSGAANIVPASAVSVHQGASVSGNVLTGAVGNNLYVGNAGAGSVAQKALSTTQSLSGSYGTLQIDHDGSYSYHQTKAGLVIGQTYNDHFTFTALDAAGNAKTSTLDIAVVVDGVGDGGVDTLTAGTTNATMSGFGAGSTLWAGTGVDTFKFASLSQSTTAQQTVIRNFMAGDKIDLSAIDPKFHIVSKFDGHANELVLSHIGTGNWEVYGDTTGSGTANFALHLMSLPTNYVLSAGDFIL